jgi:phage tail-like protein
MTAEDAYPTCRFYVQIDNSVHALFTEATGLEVTVKPDPVEEGGVNEFVHQLPGRATVGNLTLKRGMTRSHEFLKWLLEVASGRVTRRNITLIMYDTALDVVARWNFRMAYPVKWSGPQFRAASNESAVESLELAHEGVELTTG